MVEHAETRHRSGALATITGLDQDRVTPDVLRGKVGEGSEDRGRDHDGQRRVPPASMVQMQGHHDHVGELFQPERDDFCDPGRTTVQCDVCQDERQERDKIVEPVRGHQADPRSAPQDHRGASAAEEVHARRSRPRVRSTCS